MKVILETHFVH